MNGGRPGAGLVETVCLGGGGNRQVIPDRGDAGRSWHGDRLYYPGTAVPRRAAVNRPGILSVACHRDHHHCRNTDQQGDQWQKGRTWAVRVRLGNISGYGRPGWCRLRQELPQTSWRARVTAPRGVRVGGNGGDGGRKAGLQPLQRFPPGACVPVPVRQRSPSCRNRRRRHLGRDRPERVPHGHAGAGGNLCHPAPGGGADRVGDTLHRARQRDLYGQDGAAQIARDVSRRFLRIGHPSRRVRRRADDGS